VEPAPAPAADPDLRAAEEFGELYRLSGVMKGSPAFAFLGGRTIQVGAQLDGFILKSVENTSATFVRNGIAVELLMPNPATQGSENVFYRITRESEAAGSSADR
jgi:hypothetical protein